MKQYNNGQRKAMMYGGNIRKPMMYGGTAKKQRKMAKGGEAFAKLAPPYDKITYADKIAGATKRG